jgi:hypothetical protein
VKSGLVESFFKRDFPDPNDAKPERRLAVGLPGETRIQRANTKADCKPALLPVFRRYKTLYLLRSLHLPSLIHKAARKGQTALLPRPRLSLLFPRISVLSAWLGFRQFDVRIYECPNRAKKLK